MTFSGVALADTLQDSIVDSGSVSLVAGSATSAGSATIRVVANSAAGDPDQGCNFDTASETLTIAIETPTGVTASPATVTFKACGTPESVTFTASSSAESGSVTARITGNTSGGTFQNHVDIPITVTQPPNTAPVVSVTGLDATSYVIGNEPTVGCSVTDAEEPTLSATPTVDRSALVNGLGAVTVTCSVTDAGNLNDTDTASYTIVPPPNTKPAVEVTGVATGATYEIGSVPTVGCDVTDAEDVNPAASPTITGTLSHGLGSQTATCDYTDEGGLSADTATATYTIADTGNPTISHALNPAAANGNGWFDQDVAVTFTCNDAGSGIQSCTGDTTLGEGANQSATGTATDWAGNTATNTATGINIDKTLPTVEFVGGPANQGSYYFGSVPAAPSCAASDALSGLDGACAVTGGGTSVGIQSYTATATDEAGNTAMTTVTYSVLAWQLKGFYSPVDMNGVWNTVKGGSTVPLKFEAFAASELTSTAAVTSFTQKQVTCPSGSVVIDEIEIVSTGGTSLRYDATGGQFIQNWATPKKPGTCHVVTMTTQDGSKLTANFTLK
jgi:hypothetical protein